MHEYGHTIEQSRPLSARTKPNVGQQVVAAVSGAMSRVFHTTRVRTMIIGVNPCTRLLATELAAAERPVSLIGSEAEQQSNLFVSVINLNTSDELLLGRGGAETARCLVAATPDDGRNLSLCRTALETFRVPVIISRLRVLEGVTSWARMSESGMTRFSWENLIRAIAPDLVLTPALSRLAGADAREQVADLRVQSPAFLSRTIDQMPLGDCDVVMLTRKGEPVVSSHTSSLELGDVLTVIGEPEAVCRLRKLLASL